MQGFACGRPPGAQPPEWSFDCAHTSLISRLAGVRVNLERASSHRLLIAEAEGSHPVESKGTWPFAGLKEARSDYMPSVGGCMTSRVLDDP